MPRLEIVGRNDREAAAAIQDPQVSVASHDPVRLALDSGGEHVIVVWIAAHARDGRGFHQQRGGFELRYLPLEEVARALGISPGAARARVHRALGKLRMEVPER